MYEQIPVCADRGGGSAAQCIPKDMSQHTPRKRWPNLSHGRSSPPIERINVSTYTLPTDGPESDGTLEWDSTTLVLVEAHAAGETGLGYSYTHSSSASLIASRLARVVHGIDAMSVNRAWQAMVDAVRNYGRPGLAASAISAVDTALWDLKARLLKLPLVSLLGQPRESVAAYGSGGFTSYPIPHLEKQLSGWVEMGLRSVKMKVGREPDRDLKRVQAARNAIGHDAELFVDANGAYTRKQALYFAQAFADHSVSWFEEPVSSDDLEGLRLIRDRAPAGMNITAGEYGYDSFYFRRMLETGAVDILQADATRCLGISGFLEAGVLSQAWNLPLSSHTAPALHAHPCCALPRAHSLEWFHDHVRIERMLFEGAPEPKNGRVTANLSHPGLGLRFKRSDAARYAA